MKFIAGNNRDQIMLLPDSIDDYIDAENTTRVIDAYVDHLNMLELGFEKSEPNETGRPMYAPKDMLKLYIYGYMNRVRSSRNLEKETHRNLEVIWLMKKLTPDHKTIARFRQRNPQALKNVFRDFVRLCDRVGLYGKELIAIDGSKFKAWNSKDRNFTVGKLKDRIKRIDEKIDAYLKELDNADEQESHIESGKSRGEIKDIIQGLNERKKLYKSLEDQMNEANETQISLTDTDSRLIQTKNGLDVCLNVQSVVDSKNKMIVAFNVGNQAQDLNQMWPMTEQAAKTLETDCMVVVADTGYDSASDIARLVMEGYAPQVAGANFECCIPCEKESAEEISKYENGRSIYIPDRNIAICPMGKTLYPSCYNRKKQVARYANGKACKQCSQKCTIEECKRMERRIKLSEFSRTYNVDDLYVRKIKIKAEDYIIKQRKSIVEHPFGTVKRALGVDYLLMKGKEKASGEIALAFMAFNLKRAINIIGTSKLLEVIG